jgi:hypothetical protein
MRLRYIAVLAIRPLLASGVVWLLGTLILADSLGGPRWVRVLIALALGVVASVAWRLSDRSPNPQGDANPS